MERNKALEVTKALNELEGYEIFMDNIKNTINESFDLCTLSNEFLLSLSKVLANELERREKVLADL